jgi:hypothetical protein
VNGTVVLNYEKKELIKQVITISFSNLLGSDFIHKFSLVLPCLHLFKFPIINLAYHLIGLPNWFTKYSFFI